MRYIGEFCDIVNAKLDKQMYKINSHLIFLIIERLTYEVWNVLALFFSDSFVDKNVCT